MIDTSIHWHAFPGDYVEWGRDAEGRAIVTQVYEAGIYRIDTVTRTVVPWGPVAPEDRCDYCTPPREKVVIGTVP